MVLAPAGPLAAQAGGAAGAGPARPSLEAARRSGPVAIDGRIDEAAWDAAPATIEFVQGEPRQGAPPARPTEVRVLFDDEALYVAARMHEPDPAAIADQLTRRDRVGQYDYFELQLDPNLDGQTGYLFRVGASGVERDAYLHDDVEEDENWDAVWSSAVARDAAGWSVELRIPLSQIRYESRDAAQTWGVNFVRRRLASSSLDYFALRSRTVEGRVSQLGRLTGLRLAEAERRFEVVPYLATALTTAPAAPGDPFFDGSELEPRAGIDVAYGVGSAFSLDATINPDFGQVEVDPAVVNLTAFETFFSEKRPFFVQDARVFDYEFSEGPMSRLFFSRRIGREPQGEAPEGADFVDVPSRTTILGASKFTGRTRGGLTVGVLGAVTQEETGLAYFEDTDERRRFVAEPASRYGVARVQQDLRGGATRVGTIVAGVDRSLPESGSLDVLPSSAVSAGIDWEHQWGGPSGRRWSFAGHFAGTHVRGSPEAMVRIQTNPQHYFQRPDAPNLAVDSSATHMTGFDWGLYFRRQSGEHWTWSVTLEQVTAELAANEVGITKQSDQFDLGGRLEYKEIEPGPLFRRWKVNLNSYNEWRSTLLDDFFSVDQWAHAYRGGRTSLQGEFELHSSWVLSLGTSLGLQRLSDTQTRGGPLMTEPASVQVSAGVTTDPRRPLSFGPEVRYSNSYLGGGDEVSLGLDATMRPTPAFELSLKPSLTLGRDAAQYVGWSDAVPYAPTYGARYLFAELDRTELAMETRLDVAFTRDLSLELFAQPLIASGDYLTYRQLARPESFAFVRLAEGEADAGAGSPSCVDGATCTWGGERHFDFDGDGGPDYSVADPDFNLRSLRGNAVLRWEYRPGSTLFLVWQQDRSEEADVGDFRLGRDLDALLAAETRNTVILKVSHYLDL